MAKLNPALLVFSAFLAATVFVAADEGGFPGYLLVVDGNSQDLGKVKVVNLEDGKVAETLSFANTSTSVYSSSSGRFGFIMQRSANKTYIMDSGLSAEHGGDHWDLTDDGAYVMDLTLDDVTPTDFAAHRRYSAVFHDASGNVTVVSEAELARLGDRYKPVKLKTNGRQHGSAVTLPGNHIAVTNGNDTYIETGQGSSRAQGVKVHSMPTGRVVYEGSARACPGLHGMGWSNAVAMFACSDGMLVVERPAGNMTWTHRKLNYPAGAPQGARVNHVHGHDRHSAFIGALETSEEELGIYLIDPTEGAAEPWKQIVDLKAEGLEIVSEAHDPQGRVYGVLLKGGKLKILHAHTGEVLKEANGVLGDNPSPGSPQPTILIAFGRLYLANPATGKVTEHDVLTLGLLRTFDLGGKPTRTAGLGSLMYWEHLSSH